MQKLYLVKLFEKGENPWEWVLGRGCLQQPVLCTICQVLHRFWPRQKSDMEI